MESPRKLYAPDALVGFRQQPCPKCGDFRFLRNRRLADEVIAAAQRDDRTERTNQLTIRQKIGGKQHVMTEIGRLLQGMAVP